MNALQHIRRFWQRCFCRHQVMTFVRNLYGDEINHNGGKRSLWRCNVCGATIGHYLLHGVPAAGQAANPAVQQAYDHEE